MNRPTGLPWASRLGPYSPKSLCAALKKPWIAKERCPASTGGMWMTHSPSCLTKHQPTTFWRLLTNATPRSSLPWRSKIIACFPVSRNTIALFTVTFSHLHYNVFEHGCEAISGNFALSARNCLTSTFKNIVMQMRKVNCEKGYCSTNLPTLRQRYM